MVLGIYGCGGFGREALEIAKALNEKEKRWAEIVFIDDGFEGDRLNGYRVFQFQELGKAIRTDEIEIVVAIGEPAVKERLYGRLKEKGYRLGRLVHPAVSVPSDTRIGEGAIVYEGVFLSCHVAIGNNTVIMSGANISHDCEIGCHNVICGQANLGGNVITGETVFVGLSACVKQGLHIGGNTVLAMGSVVIHDAKASVVVMGNPGRAEPKSRDYRVFAG